MRGKDSLVDKFWNKIRITPAYAGKSLFCCASHFVRWDHPRLCGEKFQFPFCFFWYGGSPPPMRGKGKDYQLGDKVSGITPAYAGKRVELHAGK